MKAANLVDALSAEDGTYTVFAPTNDAFAALPAGLVDALLMPKNQKALADILTFHVLENKVMAADAVAGIKADGSGRLIATTMNGNLTLTNVGGKVMVKGEQGRVATVTATDIMATNGVVHLIDKVLLPEGIDVKALIANSAKQMTMDAKEKAKMAGQDMKDKATMAGHDMKDKANAAITPTTRSTTMPMTTSTKVMRADGPTIVDVAVDNGNFSTLTGAVTKAGLAETLSGAGEYTVFAPTDDAFSKLPAGTVEGLNNNQLQTTLKYHVIPAKITAAGLTKAIAANRGGYYRLQTLDGSSLYAYTKGGKVMLVDGSGNTATVTATDVNASNGIVHAIDGVMMPRM